VRSSGPCASHSLAMAAPTTTMKLRVFTLNVWNSEGDPKRLDITDRGLRQLDPDLLALQEVVCTPQQKQLDKLLDLQTL
jgi:hypothetical protein